MDCPRCGKELREIDVNGVMLDICDSCEGLWFDQGELGRILENAGEAEASIHQSDASVSWEGEPVPGESPSDPGLQCPKCGEAMRRYNYAVSSNILIDACEKNKCGAWLDDGEIKRIIDYLGNYRDSLDPEEKELLKVKLDRIKADASLREEALIDSLVKMDDKPGLMRIPGEMLQFVYRIMYRMGL
jgi:Zn-finger nucleic acid-binding protein